MKGSGVSVGGGGALQSQRGGGRLPGRTTAEATRAQPWI